jgi:hypothetical protein
VVRLEEELRNTEMWREGCQSLLALCQNMKHHVFIISLQIFFILSYYLSPFLIARFL